MPDDAMTFSALSILGGLGVGAILVLALAFLCDYFGG